MATMRSSIDTPTSGVGLEHEAAHLPAAAEHRDLDALGGQRELAADDPPAREVDGAVAPEPRQRRSERRLLERAGAERQKIGQLGPHGLQHVLRAGAGQRPAPRHGAGG